MVAYIVCMDTFIMYLLECLLIDDRDQLVMGMRYKIKIMIYLQKKYYIFRVPYGVPSFAVVLQGNNTEYCLKAGLFLTFCDHLLR